MIPERYREKRVFFSLRRVSHAVLKKGFYLEVRLFYYSPFFFIFTLTLAHVQLWQNHLVLSSASHRG